MNTQAILLTYKMGSVTPAVNMIVGSNEINAESTWVYSQDLLSYRPKASD